MDRINLGWHIGLVEPKPQLDHLLLEKRFAEKGIEGHLEMYLWLKIVRFSEHYNSDNI